MHIDQKKFFEFVKDSGLVDKDSLQKAREESLAKKTPLEKILVDLDLLTADQIRRIISYVTGIPFVDLTKSKIDYQTLSIIPEPMARSRNVVAYNKTDDLVELAVLDITDFQAVDFVKKKSGLKVKIALTDMVSIKSALLQYQKTLREEFGNTIKFQANKIQESLSSGDTQNKDISVIKLVETLLSSAISSDASDIHIEPMKDSLLVRFRIDGLLEDAMVLPILVHDALVARIKIISNLKLDEKRLPQDGRFKFGSQELEKVSFRVSIIPTFYGEKVVLRVLKDGNLGFTLEKLGIEGDNLEKIRKALRSKTGMILNTGPTGSGKTTTLYTMLDILNDPRVNISTIEDPIEYQIPRINQTQVKSDIGYTFASGLRSLVRQDPDILMVGEIRDTETASLATNASLTGHLVLSTLHTNSAVGSIPRLLDMGIDPFLVSSTLNVVIAQRLVRKLCSRKEKYFLNKSEIEEIEKKINKEKVKNILVKEGVISAKDSFDKIPFYRPVSSDICKDGYSGRFGIYEVLQITSSIKSLITSKSSEDKIQEVAEKEGMITLLEDGFIKAVKGETSLEEVFRVVDY